MIADYGHNPDAITALTRALASMPATRRSVMISGAGDRRDEDIRVQGQLVGEAFDYVILYQDQCQRGRADGEVVGLLREGLTQGTRVSEIDEIYGEFLAIDTALAKLNAGRSVPYSGRSDRRGIGASAQTHRRSLKVDRSSVDDAGDRLERKW